MVAEATAPCDVTSPAIVAVFVTLLTVIATPTPIEASPPSTAPPSASEPASELADDVTVTRPPDVIATPTGMSAIELVSTRLTATAAATLIGPVDDLAAGVSVEPESPPSLSIDCWSADRRSWDTSSFTPASSVTGSGSSLSAASPLAEAIAFVSTSVRPWASKATAPSASMSRSDLAP